MLTPLAKATVQAEERLHTAAAREISLCCDADQKLAEWARLAAKCWRSVIACEVVAYDIPAFVLNQSAGWWMRGMNEATTQDQLTYCMTVSEGFRDFYPLVSKVDAHTQGLVVA